MSYINITNTNAQSFNTRITNVETQSGADHLEIVTARNGSSSLNDRLTLIDSGPVTQEVTEARGSTYTQLVYRLNNSDYRISTLESGQPSEIILEVQTARCGYPQLVDKINAMDAATTAINAELVYMSAAPTSGTYTLGKIIFNSSPSILGKSTMKYIITSWICTVAGTPGTWKSICEFTGS